VDLTLINQALDASISLFLLLPEIERQSMALTLRALSLTGLGKCSACSFDFLTRNFAHKGGGNLLKHQISLLLAGLTALGIF